MQAVLAERRKVVEAKDKEDAVLREKIRLVMSPHPFRFCCYVRVASPGGMEERVPRPNNAFPPGGRRDRVWRK